MNLDPLRFVKFFAAVKHAGQTYAGQLPYTHHLAAVEAVLRRFMVGEEFESPARVCLEGPLLEAAWLHDIVEDTGTKVKEVEEMFGEVVAGYVQAVTNEPGANRKIRAALTYPKIREAGRFAVRLKLADRIANVEQGGKLLGMYAKEHESFRRALYTPGENEDMWFHLNRMLESQP